LAAAINALVLLFPVFPANQIAMFAKTVLPENMRAKFFWI
jgi:hypothetical protein